VVPATHKLAVLGSCDLATPLISLHIFATLASFTKC